MYDIKICMISKYLINYNKNVNIIILFDETKNYTRNIITFVIYC